MRLAACLPVQALAAPDHVALVCGGERLSFAQLERMSAGLAGALAKRGIGLGDRVLIFLPNGVEFVLALLALLRIGALAVPVGTRLAQREVGYIVQDAEPKAAFVARTDAAVAGIACIDSQELRRLCQHEPMRFELPAAHDECMILYTSGTTGKPKGAILTDANFILAHLVNATLWGLTPKDRYLVTTPLTHRTASGRLVNVLCLGGTLVLMERFDAAEAARLCEAEAISVIGMVPTVGRMLLEQIEAAPGCFATLRLLVATGEAFPHEVKRRILAALPGLQIHSYFAMTECGVITALAPHEQLSHPGSAGRPIPGAELRLVGNDGADVAAGEAGEVWIRTGEPGRYLTTKGYYRQSEATADALRDGWLATGDMGRMQAGHLYIVDRKKDMVLSGGYNIYSKEVEAALLEHPAVRDAAVVGVPDPVFGEAVAAFVELKPGAAATEAEIIEHCRERIASYKKPRHVRFVSALPRNATGKILKYRLREAL